MTDPSPSRSVRECGDQLRRIARKFERLVVRKAPVAPRLKWHLGRFLGPLLVRHQARRAVALNGAAVQSAYGISPAEQLERALVCGLKHQLNAKTFYLNRLYEAGRFARADEFLSDHHSVHLLAGLFDLTDPPHRVIHLDKRRFAHHCDQHGLPTVAPLWDCDHGAETFWGEATPARLPDLDLFAKQAANHYSGAGARRFLNAGPNRFRDGEGRELDSAGVLASLRALAATGCWILQPALNNHPSIAPLTNGALATFRVVTASSAAHGVEIIATALKLPAGTNVVDNFSKGNLAVALDEASGQISSPAYRRHPLLGTESVVRHPDSDQPIKGRTLPEWPAVRAIALAAQQSCPDLPFVGWDIALSAAGPLLIEPNLMWEACLFQISAAHGICASMFGRRFLEAYHLASAGRSAATGG